MTIRCPDCGVLKNADEPCPGCLVRRVIEERTPDRHWGAAVAGFGALLGAGGLVLASVVLTLSMGVPGLQDTASAGALPSEVPATPVPTLDSEEQVAPVPPPTVASVPPVPPVSEAVLRARAEAAARRAAMNARRAEQEARRVEQEVRTSEARARAAEHQARARADAERARERAVREAEMQRYAVEAAASRAAHRARSIERNAHHLADQAENTVHTDTATADELYAMALQLAEAGESSAASLVAQRALEHRTAWRGTVYTERVLRLHQLVEATSIELYGSDDPRAMQAIRKRQAFEQAAGF